MGKGCRGWGRYTQPYRALFSYGMHRKGCKCQPRGGGEAPGGDVNDPHRHNQRAVPVDGNGSNHGYESEVAKAAQLFVLCTEQAALLQLPLAYLHSLSDEAIRDLL